MHRRAAKSPTMILLGSFLSRGATMTSESEVSSLNGFARVHVLDDNHCMASWRNFVIVILRKDTTAEAVSQLRALLQKIQTTSDAICLLTVVEPNAPPPPSEVRDALAGVLGEFGKLIKFSAVAFEGSGFRAAMVRGVVTGLT